MCALVPEQGQVVVVLQDAYGPLHDARLVAPGLDAARPLVGEPVSAPGQPIEYAAGLAVLGGLALGLVILLVRRPRGRGGRVLRIALGVLVAVLVALSPRWPG